jgi:hypothetical protein
LIVRITRAAIRPNSEAVAFGILRDATAATGRPNGLEAVFIARRGNGKLNELVAVTVWRDAETLTAVLGPGWENPAFLPALDPLLIDATVDHYETVAESYEDIMAIADLPPPLLQQT